MNNYRIILFILVLVIQPFVLTGQQSIDKTDEIPFLSLTRHPPLQVPLQRMYPIFSFDKYKKNMEVLSERLFSEAALISPQAMIKVIVSDEEIKMIDDYQCKDCGEGPSQNFKDMVGLVKPIGARIDFSKVDPKYLRPHSDGGISWTGLVEIPNAVGIRIHLSDVSLPANGELYVYSKDGEAHGPYKPERGDFWTNTVIGESVYIQLRIKGEISSQDLETTGFNIINAGFLGKKFISEPPNQTLSSAPERQKQTECNCGIIEMFPADLNCAIDAGQYYIGDVKYGIGLILYSEGNGIYTCMGGLLNDTVTSSTIPYFLTANQCISTNETANSMECFYRYWSSICDSGLPQTSLPFCPRTQGATLLKTCNYHGGYTLLRLNEMPPPGSAYLGWTTAVVAYSEGFRFHRIGKCYVWAPWVYSRHTVTLEPTISSSSPRPRWIHSAIFFNIGSGAMGAPGYNENGQVIGQFTGSVYVECSVCGSPVKRYADGAFADYFPGIKNYLAPPQTLIHIQNISRLVKINGVLSTSVYITDGNGTPISNVEVYGYFKNNNINIHSSPIIKLTSSNGLASFSYNVSPLGISRTQEQIENYSFCVSNISYANKLYDSAEDFITCTSL